MNNARDFLFNLAVHPLSNQLIRYLQVSCGVSDKDENFHKKTLFYKYFKFSSMLGEEIYSLIPLLYWGAIFIGPAYALNFCCLCLGGQLFKDVFKLPRPPANSKTKIVRLEKHHETEYGMPSTHALGGLLPFAILFALGRNGISTSTEWWWLSVYYLLSVSISRLYLGVHSLLDICASVILGVPVMLILDACGEELEYMVFTHPWSIAIHILCILLFVYAVPRAAPWTASYGTSTQLFGVFIGLAISMWFVRNHATLLLDKLQETAFRNWNMDNFTIMLTKYTVGLVVVVITKVLLKEIPLVICKFMYHRGFLVEESKFGVDVQGNTVPLEKLYCIECNARLWSYGSIGVAVVILTPLTWIILGL